MNGINIIWSDDGGHAWTAPAPDRGFAVDTTVYTYGSGCELPDGSLYIAYYDPRGDQTRTAIWGVRVRIRPDRQGIDILPVGGSQAGSAAPGKPASGKSGVDVDSM